MARILLAEDDFAVRDFTYRALSMDGHDVIVAHEGQEALRCLTVPGEMMDLLLSDIRMPVIDGVTLSKIAFQNFPKLPILLMTGYAADEANSFVPSVVGVLQKPFTLDGVQSAVRAALGRSHMKAFKGLKAIKSA